MSQSYTFSHKDYPLLNGVIFCSCNTPAIGLYRGQVIDFDSGRYVACNRWLCEQCLQNLREEDAVLNPVKQQRLTAEQWEEFNRWYDAEGQNL